MVVAQTRARASGSSLIQHGLAWACLMAIGFLLFADSYQRWGHPIIDLGRDLYLPGQLLEGRVLFRDLRPYAYYDGEVDAPRCRFLDCRHDTEPGCEVKVAVKEGKVSPERYASYLRILASLASERR